MHACVRFVAGNLARRTFLTFILLAIAPLLVTGVVTIGQVSGYLTEEKTQQLEANAKAYGLQIHERLSTASRVLEQATVEQRRRDDIAKLTTEPINNSNDRYFDAIERIEGNHRTLLAGNPQRAGRFESSALSHADQKLWTFPDQTGKTSLYLALPTQNEVGSPALIVAAVNSEYL